MHMLVQFTEPLKVEGGDPAARNADPCTASAQRGCIARPRWPQPPHALQYPDSHSRSLARMRCSATAAAPVMGPLTSDALMRLRKGER